MDNKFDEYYTRIKKTWLPSFQDSPWKKLKTDEKGLSLLIGAGVTSCIVGDWNSLLNEIAVMRCSAEHRKVTPNALRDYIQSSCDGCFLPSETSPVEKGQYLQFGSKYKRSMDTEGLAGNRTEVIFSHQVLIAIERLMDRKLRDGSYQRPKPYTLQNRIQMDFINWCNDAPDPVFGICRKTISKLHKTDEAEKALGGFSGSEITQKLSSAFGIPIDISTVEEIIRNEATPFEKIKGLFGSLMDKSLEEEIKENLKEAKDPTKNFHEQVEKILRLITAHALWRPSYGTLEALLRLCVRGRIKEVISYNFDTVFDRLLANEEVRKVLIATEKKPPKTEASRNTMKDPDVCVYGMHSLQPIEMKGFAKSPTKKTIRIYHVHGLLDQEAEIKPIIFSETAYKSYQNLPFNSEKMYLANAYLQGGLLCVGFSGNDGSFRRIFDQTLSLQHDILFGERKNNNNVYLTRGLKEVRDQYHFDENTPKNDVETAYACVDTYLKMLRQYFHDEVNTDILWSEDYETLAASLMEL